MQYTDAVLSVTPAGAPIFFSIYRGLRALTRSYPRLVFLRPCRGLFSARLRLAKDSNLLIRCEFLEVPKLCISIRPSYSSAASPAPREYTSDADAGAAPGATCAPAPTLWLAADNSAGRKAGVSNRNVASTHGQSTLHLPSWIPASATVSGKGSCTCSVTCSADGVSWIRKYLFLSSFRSPVNKFRKNFSK